MAAFHRQQKRRGQLALRPAIFAAAWLVSILVAAALASSAAALDDIAIGGASAESGTNGCPALTRIKYPWIHCRDNGMGGVTLESSEPGTAPTCRLRLSNGACAAGPEPWYQPYQGLESGL